jgi:hypothetical protein
MTSARLGQKDSRINWWAISGIASPYWLLDQTSCSWDNFSLRISFSFWLLEINLITAWVWFTIVDRIQSFVFPRMLQSPCKLADGTGNVKGRSSLNLFTHLSPRSWLMETALQQCNFSFIHFHLIISCELWAGNYPDTSGETRWIINEAVVQRRKKCIGEHKISQVLKKERFRK